MTENNKQQDILREVEQLVENYNRDIFLDQAVNLFKSSESLAVSLAKNFPRVNELVKHNVSGTLMFLKTKKMLSAYLASHKFVIAYEGTKDGVEVWARYKQEIEKYIDLLLKKWEEREGHINDGFSEKLLKMREILSEYVHKEYFKKLP